jgi:hypothetical protein
MSVIGVKVLLGVLFFAFSCVAFVSMLHLLGAPHFGQAKTLRIIHRSSGVVAVALYAIVSVMCIALPLRQGTVLSPRGAIHLSFAALFIPFIVLKILIVEKYPELRNRLFVVGSVLFALVFVIFFTSGFVHLLRGSDAPRVESAIQAEHDPSVGREIFVVRCSKCHRLDRPLSARKTAAGWEETVHRMRRKDPTWISEVEAEKILRFLKSVGSE